jgi:lipoprotein-anchoring transpeptidase ErfK/SrfK
MRHIVRHAVIALAVAVGCVVLTPAVAAATTQSAAAPCGASAAACVSLSSQRAWLMRNGQVTYGPIPIASGKPGWPTPLGVHQVLRKNKNHRSRQFNNAPMPYAVFFTNSGVAFHQGTLRPSHGCVRMGKKAASTFYNTLSVGQVVQVVN